jgi:hypothetical protein
MLAAVLALAGCWASYRIESDEGARDASPADDGMAPTASCPPTLPTGDEERLERRWSARIPGVWSAYGSAGVAVRDGVLLVVPPRPRGEAPWVFPFAETTGELLREAGDATVAPLAGATAVAAMQGETFALFLGAAADGVTRVSLRPDGYATDTTELRVDWGGVVVTDLRAGGRLSSVAGLAAGGSVGRDGRELLAVAFGEDGSTGDVYPLYEEPASALPSEACVSGEHGVIWTSPAGRIAGFGMTPPATPRPFDRPPPWAPISSAPDISSSRHLLLAYRGAPPIPEDPITIESRDGLPIESHKLVELDGLVDRPFPRELAGGDRSPALAWVAHDGAAALRPACLYVTPLGLYGGPSGPSLRVDDEGSVPSSTSPEFVRLVADVDMLLVVWRCAPDLCTAALRRTPP